jgi:hypothetical protein
VLDHRPTLDKRSVAQIAGHSVVAFGKRFLRGEV